MSTRQSRALALLASAVVALAAAGCGSSGGGGGDDDAGAAGICASLSPTLPDGPCAEATALDSLAAWRGAQEPIPTASLNITVTPARGVAAAAEQAASGFQAQGRSDLPRWPLKLPLDWNADPFGDPNWRFQLNAWRLLDPLIAAWQASADPAYVADVMALVEDWHRHHVVEDRPSRYGWNDMATGIRAMKLAWLLDSALRGDFGADAGRDALLVELGERHARALRDPDFISSGNHGLFQLHGLLALCRTLPHLRSCDGGVAFAEAQMERLLGLQFTDEGVHREHSPEYHLFATDTVSRMAGSGWYEGFEFVERLLPLAVENRAWMLHPDRKVVAVGDSIEDPANAIAPAGDPDCADVAEPPAACRVLKAFPKSGYAIARSDWAVPPERASMLFFMAAFHSIGHKHADDLSFELFEFGERVLTDTGKYKYISDAWRDFARSPRAHSTLEFADRRAPLSNANAYGSGLRGARLAGGTYTLVGEAPQADTGRTHRRTLVYTPRRSLLVVDEVDGVSAGSVTQWFHFAPQVSVAPASGGRWLATLGGGRRIEVEPWQPDCQATTYRGSSSPLQGWTTVSYGEMVPRTSLGLSCGGAARAYVTLFVLDPSQRDAVRAEAAAVLDAMRLPR